MNTPLCKHLRTKKMYLPSEATDVFEELTEHGAEPFFWCNCTQRPIGPDDNAAHPRACFPTRNCYEE